MNKTLFILAVIAVVSIAVCLICVCNKISSYDYINNDSIIKMYDDSIKYYTELDSLENNNIDTIEKIIIKNNITYVKIKENIHYLSNDSLDSIIFLEPRQYKILLKDRERIDSKP